MKSLQDKYLNNNNEVKGNKQSNLVSNKPQQGKTQGKSDGLSIKAQDITVKRDFDMKGYHLSPQDISKAVSRVFARVGVQRDDIKNVVVKLDNKQRPEIKVSITKKAIGSGSKKQHSQRKSLINSDPYDSGNNKISKDIYEALKYKAFGKKLPYFQEKVRGEKCFTLTLDAEIFCAFITNAPFECEMFKLDTIPTQMSNKEIKKLKYRPCNIIVLWSSTRHFSVKGVIDML